MAAEWRGDWEVDGNGVGKLTEMLEESNVGYFLNDKL